MKKEHPIYVPGMPVIPNLTQRIQKDIETSASKPSEDDEEEEFIPMNIKIASIPMHKMGKETFNKHKRITDGSEIPTIVSDSD